MGDVIPLRKSSSLRQTTDSDLYPEDSDFPQIPNPAFKDLPESKWEADLYLKQNRRDVIGIICFLFVAVLCVSAGLFYLFGE